MLPMMKNLNFHLISTSKQNYILYLNQKEKRAINAVFRLISLILKDKSNRFFLTLGYANLALLLDYFALIPRSL